MTALAQLEAYLGEFRRRLRALIVARGLAALTLGALTVTLLAVLLGTRRAFDPGFVLGARIVLLAVLASLAAALVFYPLRSLRRTRAVRDIERRTPQFDGRIETYENLAHPGAAAPSRSPFLALLAEDTLRLARKLPVKMNVRSWEISGPAVVAFLAALALAWFAAFGPGNWRYGVRNLWAGWLVSNTLPPQHIAVTPGDTTVRRGGDLPIEATPQGFDPSQVHVYAQFGANSAWESATMSRSDDEGYRFTFFAVREPMRYYVSAAGVRSPEYRVQVVDLPRVSNVKLTYQYPDWTHLDPRTEDPGGDIRAVAGTQVLVEVTTDRPLTEPTLVANGKQLEMSSEGNVSRATLRVGEQGEYYVTTSFEQQPVKLTDEYLISVVPDNKPTVKIAKPGRDWRASEIEEVSVRVQASDDFGIDRLELHYAINGGEWRVASLDGRGSDASADKILYLEDMRKPASPAGGAPGSGPFAGPLGVAPPAGGAEEPQPSVDRAAGQASSVSLEPGDLVSYYAVAGDREQSARTDLFFIEVQPFERNYSQSMQGGGGGGAGGQQQDEISRRQKEILVATWNLIRERDEQSSYLDEQQIQDNAAMLANLQRTLAEQAKTVASRTRARQLTSASDKIQLFVRSLEQAAEAMGPAAERLADLKLQEAVPSEQEALQHLLRAESVFTDIQVAFQRGGGGGSGLAGRDLAELFELEMDMEKNQYETESRVSFDQPQQQEDTDEAIAKLQELARRQENLARQARQRPLTEQERWQQEMLRREAEELKRQLQQLQRQAANQQSQQQQQQAQGGQSAQGASGTNGAQGGAAQGSGTGQAIRQLDEALNAMNRATSNQPNADPEQARRAIEQARRQLQQALEQMTAQRRAAAQEAFSDLAERSQALYERQRQLAAELRRSLRQSSSDAGGSRTFRSDLDRDGAEALAEQKQAMREELEGLQEDIQQVARQFRSRTPDASGQLNETLTQLQQSQAIARLTYAADSIRRGAIPQVAATESVTTSALRDLQRGTEEALGIANREAVQGEQQQSTPNEELLAQLQALRRQLAELPGSAAQGGPQAGEQQGRPGQGQPGRGQPGQQGRQAQSGQGAAAGGDRLGGGYGGGGGFYDPSRGGVWDPRNAGPSTLDPERVAELDDRLSDTGRELLTLGTRLRGQGLDDQRLAELRRLADSLRRGLGQNGRNPEIIASEYQSLVNLVEQLELDVRTSSELADRSSVRTEEPARAERGYEEEVAEYFRRLGGAAP
jgi:hypothetical protein